jgi:subtilisin family serine protease
MTTVRVQYGGRTGTSHELKTNEDLVVVRTRDRAPVEETRLSGQSRRLLDNLELVTRFSDAGVDVFHLRSGAQAERDTVRTTFKQEPAIRFAGRVLADPVFEPDAPVSAAEAGAPTAKVPVIYSENLFVKFKSTQKASIARKELTARGLKIKRAVEYLPNAYFAEAPEGTGLKVFDLALDLLHNGEGVEFSHPELLRQRRFRGAFPQQWHLKAVKFAGASINAHASVVSAWKRSQGKGIIIAVIDSGIDIDHEEFRSSGKIYRPRDVTAGTLDPNDPRPVSSDEEHGTACAGVACANGKKGASGVAPAAKLMPIRLMSALGSQSEADAFAWAADHGADVISCSWGPDDGKWWNPRSPGHRAFGPLPDNTRLAIDHALTNGRGGKGCVICWAAGNGNESVDNDAYASHPGVIAVAACNDTGKRSVYSDTGKALWCAFPSDDFDLDAVAHLPNPPPVGGVWNVNHPLPKTPGIWTTDWSGKHGYNKGNTAAGDGAGNYTNSFGGTSSAAPGVAGVAALVLALNKKLRNEEVKDILKRACDRIDVSAANYDPTTGHSLLYGYGRINAANAVKLAVPPRRSRRRSSARSTGRKSSNRKSK